MFGTYALRQLQLVLPQSPLVFLDFIYALQTPVSVRSSERVYDFLCLLLGSKTTLNFAIFTPILSLFCLQSPFHAYLFEKGKHRKNKAFRGAYRNGRVAQAVANLELGATNFQQQISGSKLSFQRLFAQQNPKKLINKRQNYRQRLVLVALSDYCL